MLKRHHLLIAVTSLLATLYVIACITYMVFDHHSLYDSMWWGFVTFTTVGYGDQYPTSYEGRIAGALLVTGSVFIVIPIITAHIATRLMNDEHLFTHDEQEEVKAMLREILDNTTVNK